MSGDFWSSIAAAHRVEDDEDTRGIFEPDPLESEPESDEDDYADGVFSPQFVASTGVQDYLRSCKELGIVPVQQFVAMLERDVVSLKHRGVGPVGGRAIFECLRLNRHIRSLDLARKPRPNACEQFPDQSLQLAHGNVDAEDNQLGLNVDADNGGLEPMCRAIRDNAVLTSLDLSYNNLAARGCAAIASAFEANSAISELSLRGNNIGDGGARALAAAVRKAGVLTKLDLSDNGITEQGGAALGELIGGTGPLEQFDISWNALRVAGALAVAEGLRTSSSLVRLNLAWNGVGERGAEAVGAALKENAALQFLDVSSNRIGEQGAAGLADGLRENQSLRSLQLNGNPVGDTGVMIIIEAVGVNCAVRDLGLQDCQTVKGGAGLFDPLNPTGTYTLNLAHEYDRSIFTKLKEIDKMDEESDGSNFLNFCYKNKRVELEEGVTIQTWPDGKGNVPETGVIFFDYSSGKRVPHEARPLREEVFQSFLRELSNPGLSEQSKLLMLRTAATTHFYNAEQVRAMVRLVDFRGRVDAVVMLFRRIVDLERFYELVYLMLKPSETAALRTRLGKALKPWLPESEMEVEQITEGTTAVVFLTEEVPADEVPADESPESALTTEQPEQA